MNKAMFTFSFSLNALILIGTQAAQSEEVSLNCVVKQDKSNATFNYHMDVDDNGVTDIDIKVALEVFT